MPDPDVEKAVKFYHRGFALLMAPLPPVAQVKRWLAEEARVEQAYGEAIAPLIREAERRWLETTGSCPWCGEVRHDAEQF